MTRIEGRMKRIGQINDWKKDGGTMKHEELTDRIIAGFYQVYNTLGWGFLESVYHRALLHELQKRGMAVETKAEIDVFYDGLRVGEYFADLMVENTVILELKAAEQITSGHEAQLLDYLKATTLEVGLLLNFGPKPQIRRKVFDADKKITLPKHAALETSDPAP